MKHLPHRQIKNNKTGCDCCIASCNITSKYKFKEAQQYFKLNSQYFVNVGPFYTCVCVRVHDIKEVLNECKIYNNADLNVICRLMLALPVSSVS